MKKLLTFALCAILALALCVPAAASFTDVPADAWYAPTVAYCEENGLMSGMGGGSFAPDGAVTRAQLITTLWRLAGEPVVAIDHGFTDAPLDAWYAPALCWAKYMGIANGSGDGTFAPDAPLTRAQMAAFFHRFALTPAAEETEPFADAAAIPDWAQTPARWAKSVGLMQGKGGGVFDPDGGAKRCELAQMLQNYAEKVGVTPRLNADLRTLTPVGVTIAADGEMLVADAYNKVIWRYVDGMMPEVLAGTLSGLDADGANLGGYNDGPAAEALFASPAAIAPFLGGWAVSDPVNNTVRLIYNGQVLTLNDVPFQSPTGLAADAEGSIYVANTGDGTILRVEPTGKFTVAAEGLKSPMGLAFAGGKLYIAETDANRILVMAAGGKPEVFAGAEEDGFADGAALTEARFSAPQGLAAGPDGTVYVSDTANSAVRCVKAGQVTTLLAQPEGVEPVLTPVSPVGLALAADGTITVCDAFARVLLTVKP